MNNQNTWNTTNTIHSDLLATKKTIYDPCKFRCSRPQIESENIEYGAYKFELNDLLVKFRVAKITPTKIGQFVTLWKRIGSGPIQPYDISDPFDLFIVSTCKDNYFGQFVFPKSVLCEQDVISIKSKGGKRAIRVYPPWDKTINQQAQKTQKWQMEYFLEIPKNKMVDYVRAQKLYLPVQV